MHCKAQLFWPFLAIPLSSLSFFYVSLQKATIHTKRFVKLAQSVSKHGLLRTDVLQKNTGKIFHNSGSILSLSPLRTYQSETWSVFHSVAPTWTKWTLLPFSHYCCRGPSESQISERLLEIRSHQHTLNFNTSVSSWLIDLSWIGSFMNMM